LDLARELGLHFPAARVLWTRGYRSAAAAEHFLRPRLEDLHDPFLLRDMDRAVARLRQAIDRKEKILLYGDYDVDGTTYCHPEEGARSGRRRERVFRSASDA